MKLELDITGRRVVVFGRFEAIRRVLRRYQAAGARVTAVLDGPWPDPAARPDLVRLVPGPVTDRTALMGLLGPAWLAVTVGCESQDRTRVLELCQQLHVLHLDETPAAAVGSVTLVGGGPGTPELLTVAACQALRDADVVCYDRLGPRDALAALAPAAELIDVGKGPYHHPVPQPRIEELLIERARRGEAVVRLKGGDAFVFGRGGEELLACARAGLAVRVVPGVTSAIAVPATAGIPVTHRGLSTAFTVISGHVPPSEQQLAALVELQGTIVILMGIANLVQICAGLARAGLSPEMPAAVVERGFSDSQRTTLTSAGELGTECRRLGVTSPAVVVIGEVARLAGEVAHVIEQAVPHPVVSR